MRPRIALCIAALAIVPLVARPGSAHTEHGTYAIATTPVTGFTCCNGLVPGAPSLPVGYGGFSFVPTKPSETPVKVVFHDAVTPSVPYFVCQDLNANLICGEGNEPHTAFACGSSVNLTGFKPGKATVVFVQLAGDTCDDLATSGTIDLVYGT